MVFDVERIERESGFRIDGYIFRRDIIMGRKQQCINTHKQQHVILYPEKLSTSSIFINEPYPIVSVYVPCKS